MKSLYTTILTVSLISIFGCGKSNDPAVADSRAAVTNVDPKNCKPVTPTAQDAQALIEVAKMTHQQCQQNFQQLGDFYKATEGMTDEERRAYFQQLTQGINPPPPPPPAVCSAVYQALQKCAAANW